jgi:hypothetical protein
MATQVPAKPFYCPPQTHQADNILKYGGLMDLRSVVRHIGMSIVSPNFKCNYLYDRQVHLVNVFDNRELGRKGLQSREYIEENMPSRHACYGTVSYGIGSAGPMLVST